MIKGVLESKEKDLKMNPMFLTALCTLQALSDTDWGAG